MASALAFGRSQTSDGHPHSEAIQLKRFASSKENLANQLTAIEADLKATQEAIDRLEGSASGNDKAELSRLETTLTQYQNTYASLLRSYEEIRLAEAQAVDNVVIVEPAEVPRFPVRPRTRLNTLLAAVVGGMLATGVASPAAQPLGTARIAADAERA